MSQIASSAVRSTTMITSHSTRHSTVSRARHDIQPPLLQRAAIAATVYALTTALSSGSLAEAADTQQVEPVYFGNGCFWGRQYDFIQTEKKDLGRLAGAFSATVGYAGGKNFSPSNKVCYYYTPEKDSVYERLGHAEVVQVELRGQSTDQQAEQFRRLAKVYFKQFRKLPGGKMIRQDPQDAGPGYRNVVGLAGGIKSPFFSILEEENINKMELKQGQGGGFAADGRPLENDELNTVWIYDSERLPFYQAEMYHQYHNGLGKKFEKEYTSDYKQAAMESGQIKATGCPEYFFMGS